ncbi:MAG: DUF4384 domain-containing protein [Calothrix sp. C42_A2020_038]|nr:DUF4384 domain-containing protein [Calothrix sp. C42_A2020_038]
MERTLVASPEGVKRAKTALKSKQMTQTDFAIEVELGYTTVSNFFNRKPIYRTNFQEICAFLGLNWQDIAEKIQEVTPLGQLWQQLIQLGSATEQMGLVLVEENTLGWGKQKPSRYVKSVRLGSYIQFEINLETPGYLLLLQKDTAGEVWCFCPSCFAPQQHLSHGKTSLPQQDSPITSFPIEGTPGLEQILAVVSQDLPTLNWLPQPDDDPLQLDENHLTELIEYVNKNEECQVLYTDYNVTD